MFGTWRSVVLVYLVIVGFLPNASLASFLQDYLSGDSTTPRPARVRTFSEETIETKEISLFGWTSTSSPLPRRGYYDDLMNGLNARWSSTTTKGPSYPNVDSMKGYRGKPTGPDLSGFMPSRSSSEERYSLDIFGSRFGASTTYKPIEDIYPKKKPKKGNKAKNWCKTYEKDCAQRKSKDTLSTDLRSRIIGGRAATPKKHTYMVLIGYGTKKNRQWYCGGSLVSERYVLTAAHCTEGAGLGKAKWARVGELDISTNRDDAKPQDRNIVEWIRHPEYKEPAVYNDIALLKLDSDVIFNDWVSPICLQWSKYLPSTRVTVAGWGRIDFISETSPMLLEVSISLFNDSECIRLTSGTRDKMQLPRGILTDTMICAGEIEGGKDACTGDSGGPLFVEDGDCLTTQVGVTSIGKDCGLPSTPGIYTNVYQFLPWIESIVWAT